MPSIMERPRLTKPLLGAVPNYGHKLCPNQGAWLLTEGGDANGISPVFDLIGRRQGILPGSTNNPTTTGGRWGTGRNYVSGSSQYDELAAAALTTSTLGTAVCWVLFPTLANCRMLSFGGAAATNAGVWQWLFSSAAGFIEISARNDGTSTFDNVRGATTIAANVWYQLAVTGTGASGGWTHYLNGLKETGTVVTGVNSGRWIGGTTVTAPSQSLLAAQWSNGVLANPSTIVIDHVLLYDRVLSAGEVLNLYLEPFCWMMPDLRSF